MTETLDETLTSESVSKYFKSERVRQDITVDDVAKKLGLSTQNIEKIENNGLNWLELSPFERGYVRNYASLLGIPTSRYEGLFPSGDMVMSELHSVKRYYTHPGVAMGPTFGRFIVFLALLSVIAGALWLAWPTGLQASEQLFLHSDELIELHQRSLTD